MFQDDCPGSVLHSINVMIAISRRLFVNGSTTATFCERDSQSDVTALRGANFGSCIPSACSLPTLLVSGRLYYNLVRGVSSLCDAFSLSRSMIYRRAFAHIFSHGATFDAHQTTWICDETT